MCILALNGNFKALYSVNKQPCSDYCGTRGSERVCDMEVMKKFIYFFNVSNFHIFNKLILLLLKLSFRVVTLCYLYLEEYIF